MKTLRIVPFGAAAGLMVCLMLLGAVQGVHAQTPPAPYIDVPVRFYDFHSNKSNPEFEQPHGAYGSSSTARPMMVDSLLDLDGKPKLMEAHSHPGFATAASNRENRTIPYLNHGVRFWFRSWDSLTIKVPEKIWDDNIRDSIANPNGNTVPRYKMSEVIDPKSGRPYLEKFRPIYVYNSNGNVAPPAIGSGNWNNNGGEYGATLYSNTVNNNNGYNNLNANSVFRYNNFTNAHVPYFYDNDTEAGTVGTISYSQAAGSNVTVGSNTFPIDTAFKNVVIDATLRFVHIGDGVYEFDDNSFFPLDGRGFGNDGRDHNFSFTMEMVVDFKYDSTGMFNFRGDDDVWVFINGKLAMDIGGIHQPVNGSFRLRDLERSHALTPNGDYKMHMFYSERHTTGSSIRITTNLVARPPTNMWINVASNDLVAGDSVLADGKVQTDDPKNPYLTDYSKGAFTWTAVDLEGKNSTSAGTLRVFAPGRFAQAEANGYAYNRDDDSVYVYAEKAYTTIRLYGQYCDSETGVCVRDSADIYVVPGPATHLYVEGSRDSVTSLNKPDPIDTIRIQSGVPSNDNFYAILRDRFGNWVGRAAINDPPPHTALTALQWNQTDSTVAWVTNGSGGPQYGQGLATKGSRTESGSTPISVTTSVTGRDGVTRQLTGNSVVATNLDYTGIRIGVRVGGTFIAAADFNNQINMIIPDDTTLYVQLQLDNGQWVYGNANWTASQSGFNPAIHPITPTLRGEYRYTAEQPTTTGSDGTITVTLPGSPSIRDSVKINVRYGTPESMRFYNKRGAPTMTETPITTYNGQTALSPYAATVTCTSGVRMPIVTALFATVPPTAISFLPDKQEGPSFRDKQITWEIVAPSSYDQSRVTLDTTVSMSGDSVTFYSTFAHNTFTIRATYRENGVVIVEEILVRVVPGIPDAVYIEPADSDRLSPNYPIPIDTLVMSSSDNSMQVFAVLRDKDGNYFAHSGSPSSLVPGMTMHPRPTAWSVDLKDPPIATADNGTVTNGQGIITRENPGESMIRVTDSNWTFKNNAVIIVRGFFYDSLMIARKCEGNANNYCQISELEITTNDTITIFVFGKRSNGTIDGGCTPNFGETDECWDLVTVDWSRNQDISSSLRTPPSNTNSWLLDPQSTGNGQIYVSRTGATDQIIHDTLDITIKLGPPQRAELVILSPADSIRAGDNYPIRAEVRYYNRIGLMDDWDDSWGISRSTFIDNLGLGNTPLEPKVKTDITAGVPARDTILGYTPGYTSIVGNNNSTVSAIKSDVIFIIYNAADGANHTITFRQTSGNKPGTDSVFFDLTATATFRVLPGELARIEIRERDTVPTVIELDHPGKTSTTLTSVGYDEYGNRLKDNVPAKWCAGGNIPGVNGGGTDGCYADNDLRNIIDYNTSQVNENGEGWMKITIPGTNVIGDSVKVVITGVTVRAVFATTRDIDGCGYLDRIDLRFERPMALVGGGTKLVPDATNKLDALLTIKYRRNGDVVEEWKWDSLTVSGNDVYIHLRESEHVSNPTELQTGWLPEIVLYAGLIVDAGNQELGTSTPGARPVVDGAPPVILKAERFHDKNGNTRLDQIKITFSEPVRDRIGASFNNSSTDKPGELFSLWEHDNVGNSDIRTQTMPKRSKARGRLAKSARHEVAGPFRDVSVEYLSHMEKIEASTTEPNVISFRFERDDIDISQPRHFINIRANHSGTPRAYVIDNIQNIPDTGNRRVPVVPDDPPIKAKPIPNPASPDKLGPNNGNSISGSGDKVKVVTVGDNKDALHYIKNEGGGGAIFQVPIYIPSDAKGGVGGTSGGTGKIRAQVKVYDLVGNLVNSGTNNNLLVGDNAGRLTEASEGTWTSMDLYWHGYNSKGMKVAPGTYRIIVQVSYDSNDPKAKNRKFQGTLGISK